MGFSSKLLTVNSTTFSQFEETSTVVRSVPGVPKLVSHRILKWYKILFSSHSQTHPSLYQNFKTVFICTKTHISYCDKGIKSIVRVLCQEHRCALSTFCSHPNLCNLSTLCNGNRPIKTHATPTLSATSYTCSLYVSLYSTWWVNFLRVNENYPLKIYSLLCFFDIVILQIYKTDFEAVISINWDLLKKVYL